MQDIIKFRLTPTIKRYYDESKHFGIYVCNAHDKIPYYNSKTFFGNKYFYTTTIIGSMQELYEGAEYDCEATYEYNAPYKQHQYKVINIKPVKPITLEDQKKFLKCIISEKQTEALLSVYPNIVDMVLNEEDVDLSLVKGIKDKTFNNIKTKIVDNFGDIEIINMLKPYGITDSMIKKLKEKHPNTTLLSDIIYSNPYTLTEIDGLGFKKVDALALSINPSIKDSLFRATAFVKYKLNDIANGDGHTRIKVSDLDKMAENDISECLGSYNKLIKDSENNPKTFTVIDGYIGLTTNLLKERIIYEKLVELDGAESRSDISDIDIELAFKTFYDERGYNLTDEQKEIVSAIIENNVVILTGNAGSGKSSCIYALHLAFKQLEEYYIGQCALSAKASQRIAETTKAEASTIHRLLGANDDGFKHNSNNPLPFNMIILDEASMVNIDIFKHLVTAINNGTKFVIVFDDAQLPPIGAGNVATDLLSSKFKKVQLTKVHRQAEASGILSDANIIRQGVNPIKQPQDTIIRGDLKDQFYMFRQDTQEMFDLAIKYYMKSIESLSVDDVVICVPRKANVKISTLAFNLKIQDILLGDVKESIKYGDKIFKLGAKVIQRSNNPALGIFNGDIGYVVKIGTKEVELEDGKTKTVEVFTINFNGRLVELEKDLMNNVELAYALTCHLLQGSQYHTVITVLSNDSYILLSKEMTYTAITRAEKRGLVIAQPRAFNYGCKKKSSKRSTWLQTFV